MNSNIWWGYLCMSLAGCFGGSTSSQTDKPSSIRANMERINAITSWTRVDTTELWNSSEGGEALFFFHQRQLEKITTEQLGETFRQTTEYYLLNGVLSLVLEKTLRYNRPIYYDTAAMREHNDTEAFDLARATLITNSSYFYNGQLIYRNSHPADASNGINAAQLTTESLRLQEAFQQLLATTGENSTSMQYFIIPKDTAGISIVSYTRDTLTEHAVHPVTPASVYAVDNQGRLALLTGKGHPLHIIDIRSGKQQTFPLPYALQAKSITLNGPDVFIGGEMEEEMLLHLNITSGQWSTPAIPEAIKKPGKAIDEVIVDGDFLVAVDNIIIPKYVLYYRYQTGEKPVYSHRVQLKTNGAYEHIARARIQGGYMGLLSFTHSIYAGTSGHVTVYDQQNMHRSFAVTTGRELAEQDSFTDFAFVGNKLLLASREKGLGILTIKDDYFKTTGNQGHAELNAEPDTRLVSYRHFGGKTLQQITVIPGTGKVVLSLADKHSRYTHEIIALTP